MRRQRNAPAAEVDIPAENQQPETVRVSENHTSEPTEPVNDVNHCQWGSLLSKVRRRLKRRREHSGR